MDEFLKIKKRIKNKSNEEKNYIKSAITKLTIFGITLHAIYYIYHNNGIITVLNNAVYIGPKKYTKKEIKAEYIKNTVVVEKDGTHKVDKDTVDKIIGTGVELCKRGVTVGGVVDFGQGAACDAVGSVINTVGKGIIDVGEDIGEGVVDVGKDLGKGVVTVGKKVGNFFGL